MRRDDVTAAKPLPSRDLQDDVVAGLLARRKTRPSKYLYDAEGSRLFERICDLPEYYVARTEVALLKSAVAEITEALPRGAALIEFGSGSSTKTRLLLDGRADFRLYIPIDISEVALSEGTRSIRKDYPSLEVSSTCAARSCGSDGKSVTFKERGFRQPPQKSCLAGCSPRWMSFVPSATGN
jgi:uncharacterized SAM-dependent methyltransferase